MKRIVALSLTLALTQWAAGEMVLDFQMNDAQGTLITGLQNGAGGGAFNYGDNNMATDGNGALIYGNTGSAQNNYGTANFTRSLTNETGRMSFSFSSVDMTTETNAELTYQVREASDPATTLLWAQLIVNGGELKLIMNGWGNVASLGTLAMSTPLDVTVDFDLVNGTAAYDWSYNGSSGTANVTISGTDAGSIVQVYQANDVAGNFFGVDSLTVEAIPEPATLGLVGLLGSAIFFIRRHFMI